MQDLRDARHRKLTRARWAGAFAQGSSALVQLAVMALLVRHLHKDRFGVWSAMASVGGWLLLGNFGLANALLTRLSAVAHRADQTARALAGAALLMLGGSAAVLAAAAVLIAPHLPWPQLLHVEAGPAAADMTPTMLVVLVLSALSVPALAGAALLNAYQRGDWANWITAGASLGTLAAVAAAVALDASLPVLAAIIVGTPVVAGLAQGGLAYTRLLPRGLSAAPLAPAARQLLATGVKFLVLELSLIVVYQTGAVIIARQFKPADVTPYMAALRVVTAVVAVQQVMLFPLWPAYGEAWARHDRAWIRATLRRSLWLTVGVWALGAAGLGLLGKWFIGRLAGEAAVPSTALLWVLIVYTLGQGLGMAVAMPLNGAGRLGGQLLAAAAMTLLHIPLALLLCGRVGPCGVPISQTILVLLVAVPICVVQLRNLLRHADDIPVEEPAPIHESVLHHPDA